MTLTRFSRYRGECELNGVVDLPVISAGGQYDSRGGHRGGGHEGFGGDALPVGSPYPTKGFAQHANFADDPRVVTLSQWCSQEYSGVQAMSETTDYILDRAHRPSWLEYPNGFRFLSSQGLVRFGQWELLTGATALTFSESLVDRYHRQYFALAHRRGSDDVACLESNSGEAVKVINGYTQPGQQVTEALPTFWDWFRSVVDDMIDFAEGEVADAGD